MKTASDDYFFTISPGQNQKLIKRITLSRLCNFVTSATSIVKIYLSIHRIVDGLLSLSHVTCSNSL